MTSTTSLRSRFHEFSVLYRWAVRKNIGMLLLLTLLLFMALPMILLISAPNWLTEWKDAVSLADAEKTAQINARFSSFVSNVGPMLALPLLMVFAVALTIALFGYMQKKRSVDFYHALPVGRVSMLLSGWCAGLTVLYAPLVLNMLAVQIIGAAYGFHVTGDSLPPVAMLFWMLLMIAAVYSFCVLMMVCSGSVFDTAVSVLGISIGYPLLILCGNAVAQMLLPGFAWDIGRNMGGITALSPFAAAFVPVFSDHGAGMLAWWIVLTILMLAGACLVYLRRKSEAAEDSFAFSAVKIVIRFLVTAVAGMGLGLMLTNASRWGFFIGLLTGSVAAHVIVEAVYSRGFRQLKKSMVWYAGFAALFLVFYGVLSTGFFGYDMRVPEAGNVQSVQVKVVAGYNSGSGCNQIFDENNYEIKELIPEITKPEGISTVVETHKKVAALIRSGGYPYILSQNPGERLNLVYRLKNGKTLQRSFQYFSPNMDFDAYHASLKGIATMEEYYRGLDMIFYIQPEDIESIGFSDNRTKKAESNAVSLGSAKELLEALREDYSKRKVNMPSHVVTVKAARTEMAVQYDGLIVNIDLHYKRNIEPKDSRLIALLGSYKGKINLNSYGGYSIYDKDTATYRLLQKLGLEH